MATGNRLAEIRAAEGVSQSALAREMGIDKSTIWRWEKGERQMDNDTLRVLCERFGCSVEHLLGWDRPKAAA